MKAKKGRGGEAEIPGVREGRKGAQGLYVDQRDKNNDVEIN